jgi:hypothetical protein
MYGDVNRPGAKRNKHKGHDLVVVTNGLYCKDCEEKV